MKKKVLLILKCLFGLLMIFSLINIFMWYRENKKVKKIVENVQEYLVIENDKYQVKEDIIKENEDTIGWIKIEGTNINYPVVQTKDNDYYLKHDYNKNSNSAGWIYMDYRNTLEDNNIIVYGHHRRDGSMFGDMDKLFKEDFYKNNTGEILLIIGEENIKYEIFSVYIGMGEDLNPSYNNLKKLEEKSLIKFNKLGDGQIITLVTCHNNNQEKLIVHGVKKLT